MSRCCHTNPKPWWLASVHSLVGLFMSKNESTVATVRDALAVKNALSWVTDNLKSFFELSKGRSGVSNVEMVFVLAESWLTKPKNDRRSVWLVGVGNFEMVSIILWSTW